jgi:hypothetical protein
MTSDMSQTKTIPNKPIKRSRSFRKLLAPLLVLLCALVIGVGVSVGVYRHLGQYKTVIAIDEPAIATDDAILKEYLATHGPDQAIAAIKAMPGVDCHQRVHKVGRINYELRGNDAFKVLNSECMSGYTHGVTEAFFHEHGTQNLTESLKMICQGEQNSFYSHQCYHGIGHGLMAYNDYDLPVALKECDTLPLMGTNQESCYSGVFMENVVGAIASDEVPTGGQTADFHYSKYLNDDPLYPCNAVEARYRSSCYFFQSSRMIEIFGIDYKKVADSCSDIEQVYQMVCFMSMGRDVDNSYSSDFKRIETSCYYAPTDDLALACISGASQDRFWHVSEQDEALALCRAMRPAAKSRCYIELASRARDIIPSPEARRAFCGKYEEAYKPVCGVPL